MRRAWSSRALELTVVVVLAASAFALVRRERTARGLAMTAQALVQELRNRADQAESNAREFERLLRGMPLADAEVAGDTVHFGRTDRGLLPSRRLLVVLSTRCPACETVLPFLDSLEQERPGRVIAVSDDDKDALAEYALRHNLPYPVLRQARGDVLQRLPRHGTPVLLAFGDARVRAIGLGVPDSTMRAQLRIVLRDQPGGGSSLPNSAGSKGSAPRVYGVDEW